MIRKSVSLAALFVAFTTSSAWSQYPGYLPYDAARLGQDVNRQQFDQYRANLDRARFNQDLATGNVGGAVFDAQRLQQDRNRLQYDRFNTQIDANRVAGDINGGYNPGFAPGGYLPPAPIGPGGGGFIYAGGQFQGPW